MKFLFAGEGTDDLGGWAGDPVYRPRDAAPANGIIHELLARFFPAMQIVDGIEWKKVRKYKAGDHASPEARTVLGLALMAEEHGCALAFVRDRDRDEDRELDVEDGIERAAARFAAVPIVGGTANEEIEAWLLALLEQRGAEQYADAKAVLAEKHGIATRREKIEVARTADLSRAADDCRSFDRWRQRAERSRQ